MCYLNKMKSELYIFTIENYNCYIRDDFVINCQEEDLQIYLYKIDLMCKQ